MRLLQRLAREDNIIELNNMYLELFNFLKSYISTYNNSLQNEKIKWSI